MWLVQYRTRTHSVVNDKFVCQWETKSSHWFRYTAKRSLIKYGLSMCYVHNWRVVGPNNKVYWEINRKYGWGTGNGINAEQYEFSDSIQSLENKNNHLLQIIEFSKNELDDFIKHNQCSCVEGDCYYCRFTEIVNDTNLTLRDEHEFKRIDRKIS